MKGVTNIFGNIPHIKEEPGTQCLLLRVTNSYRSRTIPHFENSRIVDLTLNVS